MDALEAEHNSWNPRLSGLACQGEGGDGSGTPVMAGLGLQRLGPSLCAGCGCRAGSGVAASRDTFFFF